MMNSVLGMLAVVATASGMGIGDRLTRTYTEYIPMPISTTGAKSDGWAPLDGTCNPEYGIAYGNKAVGRHSPMALYFTPSGEVAGVSVDVFGSPPPQRLVDAGYFTKVAKEQYRIHVSFRANPCGKTNGSLALGDRLVVANTSLPLTQDAAEASGWHAGSCFEGMGTHYFYDLATAPHMSWEAANLFPVVLMYNNAKQIQAFFFASWTVQQEVIPPTANTWEPIPLPNFLMCKNTCDSDCTFHGTTTWSTSHIYLRSLDLATCPGGCKIHCCNK